jgi:hypothetical protein
MLNEDADTPLRDKTGIFESMDDGPMMNVGAVYKVDGLDEIRKSTKQLMQLTWLDIEITAQPS